MPAHNDSASDPSDDSDYAPPSSPKLVRSKRSAAEDEANALSSKRAKVEEDAKRKNEAAAAWASILSVEEEAKKEREKGLADEPAEEMIEVSRPRNFAGEVV